MELRITAVLFAFIVSLQGVTGIGPLAIAVIGAGITAGSSIIEHAMPKGYSPKFVATVTNFRGYLLAADASHAEHGEYTESPWDVESGQKQAFRGSKVGSPYGLQLYNRYDLGGSRFFIHIMIYMGYSDGNNEMAIAISGKTKKDKYNEDVMYESTGWDGNLRIEKKTFHDDETITPLVTCNSGAKVCVRAKMDTTDNAKIKIDIYPFKLKDAAADVIKKIGGNTRMNKKKWYCTLRQLFKNARQKPVMRGVRCADDK